MGCGKARREASLWHCGRNFYVSGWGGGGLEGKAVCGTAVGLFFTSHAREEKRMQAQEKNIDSGKTSNQHPHSSLAHHELNSVSRSFQVRSCDVAVICSDTYVRARLFHLFSLPIAFLARMEMQQLKGALAENATVPLRVWVGRSANKCVARWRRRWRLRRGKLQDADLLALDTLRTRARQVGGFAAPFLGPLNGTETEAEEVGETSWVPDSRLCSGAPNPSLIKVYSRAFGSQVPLPPCPAPMAGDGVLADCSIFETGALESLE